MSNKLEEFVREHRGEFDVNDPSAGLWHKIDAGIHTPAAAAGNIKWLKYLVLGASAVALCLYLIISAGSRRKNIAAKNSIALSAEPMNAPAAAIEQAAVYTGKALYQKQESAAQVKEAPLAVSEAAAGEQPDNSADSLPKQDNFIMRDVSGINTPFRLASENNAAPLPTAETFAKKEMPQGNWQRALNDVYKIDTLFEGVKNLDINCSDFDVNISSHAADNIIFKATREAGTKSSEKEKNGFLVKYEKRDSTLYITVSNRPRSKIGFNMTICKASLSFEVPKATNLSVRVAYGNITASDLSGRSVNFRSHSGDVKVENINTNISLGSLYGNISAKAIKGNLNAMLSSGDLQVMMLTGNLDIKSNYGNQVYNHITGNLYANSKSGDIKVMGMKGDMNVTSGYGNTTLENYTGSPSIVTSSGDVTGKNVELTGSMKVSSNYGSVKIALVNALEDLSFDLETKYGTISVTKDGEKFSDEKKLLINRGKILVKGVTNSGDQYYR